MALAMYLDHAILATPHGNANCTRACHCSSSEAERRVLGRKRITVSVNCNGCTSSWPHPDDTPTATPSRLSSTRCSRIFHLVPIREGRFGSNLSITYNCLGKMVSSTKGKVFVTGAAGFIASWIIKRLLESGYHVIGTVRNPENRQKVAHLWKLPGAKERLQIVRADLLEEGSFDDAVMACEGVFHTASPVLAKSDSSSKEETLVPAVNGTLNVLRSCKKNPFLKRVVLTSSSSAVRVRDDARPMSLDETIWSSVPLCEKMQLWYALAKVFAEKAAWDFAKENDIDLVTVLPSFVIGPSLSHELCVTASDVLGLFQGDTARFSSYGRMGYVHIDDVASSHILVYETPEATGRYLCSSVVLDNDELASFLAKRYPIFPLPRRLNNPYGKQSYELNTAKLQALGFKFRGLPEMFDDCVQSLKDQGHLLECPL